MATVAADEGGGETDGTEIAGWKYRWSIKAAVRRAGHERQRIKTMGVITNDRSVEWAIRAMDWCVRRHRVISSNIVNRDTPGYRAGDVNFQKVMEQIDTEAGRGLRRTDAGHLPALPGGPSQVMTVKDAPEGLDGNSVNLSEEMAHLVENNYTYQALLKHVSRKLQALKIAIQGG